MIFNKRCEHCGEPATVQLNNDKFYCSKHALEAVEKEKR